LLAVCDRRSSNGSAPLPTGRVRFMPVSPI
jgi:hypothetical protein